MTEYLSNPPNVVWGQQWAQVKGSFFNCPPIWTVATFNLTYKQQKRVRELFMLKYVLSKSDFFTFTPHL